MAKGNHQKSLNDMLVSGASGFVGEHLLRRLIASGATPIGTYHRHPLQIEGATMVPLDWTDRAQVRTLLRRFQPRILYHLAALTSAPACEADPAAARQDIVVATENLVQESRQLGPAPWIVALSTDLVFQGDAAPYQEADPAKPLSVYGRCKLEAEQCLPEETTIVRASLLYGPPTTHGSSFLSWLVGGLLRREPVTLFTDEIRTPLHVDDLVNALIALGEAQAAGLWHAGGPERLDRFRMGQIVARTWGEPETYLKPSRLADAVHAAPRPKDVSLDSRKLWTYLNQTPRSFGEGIADARRHWRDAH